MKQSIYYTSPEQHANEEGGKMQKGLKKIGLGLIAVGLSVVLLSVSVVPAKAVEEAVVVRIGLPTAFTGAAAIAGWSALAVMDYLDVARGSIPGVRLECRWEECGRAPITLAVTAHKRLISWGEMLEFHVILDAAEIVAPRLPQEEIPLLLGCPSSERTVTKPIPWAFSFLPSGEDYFATGPRWFIENWTEKRPARIGMLMYDQAPAWHGLAGVKALIEGYGSDKAVFVGYEVVPFLGAIDTSVEWLRLAEKKPDLIFTGSGRSYTERGLEGC